ncbi:unnamed protein product [Schistosoma rodhaini]|nr:unnamed protein product [Schistosoma rodhaini]
MCCLIAATGFTFLVFGVTNKNFALLVATFVCWCCEMFILIIFTVAYLKRYSEQKHFMLSECLLNIKIISIKFGITICGSGVILILIGLVHGLIIIIIRKQHSSTIISSIFIVITMISMDVGVALLISLEKWGEIGNECFDRCSLDLLVLHNVYCDYIHNCISESMP